jgi:hypothetical protein
MLVLSALGVELQERRGFTASDFRKRHPLGVLGEARPSR